MDDGQTAPAVQRPFLKLALVALVFGAAGSFGGALAWDAYKDWRAEKVAQAQKLAADAERKTPKGQHREAIKLQLFDPDSAEFRNERQSKRDDSTWCGQVNGRNRMGAKVGFTRYVVELRLSDMPVPWLAKVRMEPGEAGHGTVESEMFNGVWRTYCE